MAEYSAGLTSQLFWLQESRKTASLLREGKSKADIKEIAWTDNIFQVKAEYRAIEILNHTYRRMNLLPETIVLHFASCNIGTARIINLVAVMIDSRIFFEFMHDVYAEKVRMGEKEITDRDLNVFFTDKALQSGIVAGWTERAIKKMKQGIVRILFEAGLVESSKRPCMMQPIHVDYQTEDLLKQNGLEEYLKAITGE